MNSSGMMRDDCGSTVETMFWVLIAVLLFFGAVEIGHGFAVKDALDTGVSLAVRQLSLDPSAWGDAVATVRGELAGNFTGSALADRVTLSVLDPDGSELSAGELAALPFGTLFRLRGSLPLDLTIPFLGRSTRTLQVEHWSIVERFP